MQLYLQHLACDSVWHGGPVLAGDHTAWPRLAACTLRDRTVEYPPGPAPRGAPIPLRHDFSTFPWVSQLSWASPPCTNTSQAKKPRSPPHAVKVGVANTLV